MKRIALVLLAALIPIARGQIGSDSLDYPVGETLFGKTSPSGNLWSTAGTSLTTAADQQAVIGLNNLSVAGLAASSGNSLEFGPLDGPSPRFNFGTTISSGTVYFSFAMSVADLGALGTSGGFLAGFNNSTGDTSPRPTAAATRVYTRATGDGGFNLGLSRNSGSGGTHWQWDARRFETGETIFLVGSYTFVSGTLNDVSKLWINPDASTFGSAIEPAATLLSDQTTLGTTADFGNIPSFIFFQRGSASAGLQPGKTVVDELRIGLSWGEVTPAVPEPGTFTLAGLAMAALAGWFRLQRKSR
ncbi:MAG: PEP-CTERM sorting domain-containing protein [Verrucomicrobiota bacterium]|jgi:hypothetical protein